MDSMPPPTPTSRSPARMAWSSSTDARSPDAQTLLIVSEETSFGMPALIWACRDGICPWPAWSTCPMTTCSTRSGSTSARSSAHLIACPPSSVASSVESPPPSFPIGVRAVPRMTVLGIGGGSWVSREGVAESMVRAHMRVTATTDAPVQTPADTVAIGVFADEGVAHDTSGSELQALLERGEARPAFKHVAVAHADGKRWLLVGLGDRDAFGAER